MKIEAAARLAIGFSVQQVLHFKENQRWFANNKFEIEIAGDDEVRQIVLSKCSAAIRDDGTLSICIDISSMSRYRIAVIVDVLRTIHSAKEVRVDFLYASAEFTSPPEPLFANAHVGPVLKSFAGWSGAPEHPVSAIVGLGYEPDKALGAVEHLQASEVWIFEPVSVVTEYTKALRESNRSLLEFVPDRRRLQYHLQKPFTLYSSLHALAGSLLRSTDPVILPFGPKLFSLVSLLVACDYDNLAIWRVSAGLNEPPIERRSNGVLTGLSAVLNSEPDLLLEQTI